jgi:hypothetical protein
MRLIGSNTYATPTVEKFLIPLGFLVITEKWIIALVSTKLVTPLYDRKLAPKAEIRLVHRRIRYSGPARGEGAVGEVMLKRHSSFNGEALRDDFYTLFDTTS